MTTTDKTPTQRVDAILAEAVGRDLNSWEKNEFLPNVRNLIFLSPKQEHVLRSIEKRIFKEG